MSASPSVTVVTCRIGAQACPTLDVQLPDADHLLFTDRPDGVPDHWEVRPVEFWATTDDLTRSWVECHLGRIVDDVARVLWIDPVSGETRPIDGFDRERWLEISARERKGSTTTGSLRWFGDQTIGSGSRRTARPSLARVRATTTPVSIVVPVHNAPEHVEQCLDSVVRAMGRDDRLIVVDDGSDPETARLCARYTAFDRVTLIRRPEGSGFAAAANAGIASCDTPFVIVLNSDTIVPLDWSSLLITHLENFPEVGAVGPVSNAARFQSIPHLPRDDVDNRLPAGLDLESLNRILRRWSAGVAPVRVPLLNGFCLAFRRSTLDDVGLFDTDAFPRGFGEENDWCRRATRAGWDLLVATDVYVEHAKGRSYPSHEVERLKANASIVLTERYGQQALESDLTAMRYPAALVALRADTQALWAELRKRTD
jgi:GT2 family glycosyltransferase